MGEVTWGYFSMRQQELLRDLVLGSGATLFDRSLIVMAENLEEYGVITLGFNHLREGFDAMPTELGKKIFREQLPYRPFDNELAPAQPAPADAGGKDVDYERLYNSFIKSAQIASQTQERTIDRLQLRIEALEAALEQATVLLQPFVHEAKHYLDYVAENNGRADAGNYITNYRDLDEIMDACERALKAHAKLCVVLAQQAADGREG